MYFSQGILKKLSQQFHLGIQILTFLGKQNKTENLATRKDGCPSGRGTPSSPNALALSPIGCVSFTDQSFFAEPL